MKLDQLHADADLLRQHSLPLTAGTRDAAEPGERPMPGDDEIWTPAHRWAGDETCGDRPPQEATGSDTGDEPLSTPSPRPLLFGSVDDAWPAPPPPPDEALARSSWLRRAVEVAARRGAGHDMDTHAVRGVDGTASRRQVNLAPWLAAGVVGIVLLALGAGLISHRRIDAEAAQLVDGKRRAAEQALALLHAASTPGAQDAGAAGIVAPASDPFVQVRGDAPSDVRARHDAMLASIKTGTVLASLPPSALAQPTALPAELPPVTAATSAPRVAVSAPPRPPKKVALIVEGAPPRVAVAAAATDPLAATTVKSALKGASNPQHRVYQLRESDGEWLGFVARADADPLAAGVWAGSGDLLSGGWRVADVTAQRMTLVGANGALEILRP